jgi:WhiB family redox-sensing transcriptional regulator
VPRPVRQSEEWKQFGACRTEPDKDRWFAHTRTEANETDAAKAVCGRCPVALQCLRYALAADEPWGIWGGLDRHQRKALTARRVGREATS